MKLDLSSSKRSWTFSKSRTPIWISRIIYAAKNPNEISAAASIDGDEKKNSSGIDSLTNDYNNINKGNKNSLNNRLYYDQNDENNSSLNEKLYNKNDQINKIDSNISNLNENKNINQNLNQNEILNISQQGTQTNNSNTKIHSRDTFPSININIEDSRFNTFYGSRHYSYSPTKIERFVAKSSICFRKLIKPFKRRIRIKSSITVSLGVLLLVPLLLILIIMFLILGRNPSRTLLHPLGGAPPPIRAINNRIDRPFVVGCVEPDVSAPRENAVLVILARSKELDGVVDSIKSLERHFNRWFHYPYVFLNDEEFDEAFKIGVQNFTSSHVEFGTIDPKMWNFPEWVDSEYVNEAIASQGDRNIMYGGMSSYHRMCRFYSGYFYKHPLLAKYDWYWRVEPDVKYFCDITYDPFVHMARNKKVYGFTITITELEETVPNLFRYTKGFIKTHNITTKGMWDMFLKQDKDATEEGLNRNKIKNNEILFTDPNYQDEPDVSPFAMHGEEYNMCHFWSNFEIARLDFFRSKEYNDYFETLDRSGGFWTERWGDAPVHSLAAGMFLDPSQVHYFRDIGYRHTTIQHCPANAPGKQLPRKAHYFGDPTEVDVRLEDQLWDHPDPEEKNGVGCRCVCDTDVTEVEGKEGSCLSQWVNLIGGWTA